MLVRLYQSRGCQEVHLHHFHMISLMFSRLVDGMGGISQAPWEHMGWIKLSLARHAVVVVVVSPTRFQVVGLNGRQNYVIMASPVPTTTYHLLHGRPRLTSYCGQCDAEKKELITDGPEMAGRDCVTRVDRLRKWQNPDPDNRLRPRPRPRP